uniref:PH domain-containing protein n=1 Tax=Peronospora matthiolae TaxID=2874970 RepID=A0AAV1VDK7_9STRA
MTRQGYLIVYNKRSQPSVCYLSLEDGYLRQYATPEGTLCVSELQLSGCKVDVKAHKRADGVPHSFYLELRKVFVTDRLYTLGAAQRIDFTASSSEDRQAWGKALFSWQRFYWREPQALESPTKSADATATRRQLEQLLATQKQTVRPPQPKGGPFISFASAKQPLSFLRRNAQSLHRSLVLSITSTTGNTQKPGRGVELTTDCRKVKVGLANVECRQAVKSDDLGCAATATPHGINGGYS